MDEAVQQAIGRIDETYHQFRNDFAEHVKDDKAVWKQVEQWSGGIKLASWCLGIGIPAILGALIAHVVRHW